MRGARARGAVNGGLRVRSYQVREKMSGSLLHARKRADPIDQMFKSLFRKRSEFDVSAIAGRATELLRQGRIGEAERLLQLVLKAQPDHFDALHLLGVTKLRQGRHGEAAVLIADAVRTRPDAAEALSNLGLALQALGRHQEALQNFDKALAIHPDAAGSHVNRAATLHALGRHEEALASYERALVLSPDSVAALSGRGSALRSLQRYDDALDCCAKSLAIQPDHAESLFQLAQTLQASNRGAEALAAFNRVLALEPEHVRALLGRGNVLHMLGRSEEAIADYDNALLLGPDIATTEYNRGVLLHSIGRRDDAVASFSRALDIRPDYPDALHNLAIVLSEQKHFDEALISCERLVSIAPTYPHALGNVAYLRAQLAQWKDRTKLVQSVEKSITCGQRAAVPFVFLTLSQDAAAQLACAVTHVKEKHPQRTPIWNGTTYRHDRIRIAYVSANFHEHAMAYLMAGLFERHDRNVFEVTAISLGPNAPSAMRNRLMEGVDRFIDVRKMSDFDVATMMRELEIDIAVDLMGFTGDARPDIFAYRSAPVQVNYLGFPGTMGADYIDYILADRFVIPESLERLYSEKVVYLPDTFQANDSKRLIAERTPSRAEVGLPELGFVFCSFNNTYKITPQMFEIWMRLLLDVDGSVLWLLGDSASDANLRREAELRGVSPARLVFAPRLPYPEHLARYRLADLFLDTLPFNAGTTASDALWAGLPLLTCAGQSFAARMAGSLLTAIGLPELITHSLEAYEALARALATQPDTLGELRERLGRNRLTAPLFDTDLFRRHAEAAYRTMWERSQRQEAPSAFAIVSPKA